MKKITLLIALVVLFFGSRAFPLGEGGIQGGGGSGTTNASDLSSGVVAEARGGWGEDVSSKAGIPYMNTGTHTWYSWANFMLQLGVTCDPADNTWVFIAPVTFPEAISSAADNTRGVTVPNTADPTGANLALGKCWFNITTNSWKCRNGDNSATLTYAQTDRLKTFSFAIDNVAATDNVLMWRVPVAVTITQVNCYASTDNVIGNLMECATDDVTSCTVLDAWTVTNAANDFTDASMTDGAVASGAWIRWSTTSVGSALNRLTCTIQYNE